jgi:hypothetical protein
MAFLGGIGAVGVYWLMSTEKASPLEPALAAPKLDRPSTSGNSDRTAGQRTNEQDTGESRRASTDPHQPGGPDAPRSGGADAMLAGAPMRPSRVAEIDAIWQRYRAGEQIEARHELNAMLANYGTPEEQARIREHLTRIADETILSARRLDNDPLVDSYTVPKGDNFVAIGKRCSVPPGVLMQINGISDARRLGEGQNIKLLKGPFHVKIDTSDFRMDVYLQDLYVRSYPVALGAEGRTPLGVWRVKNRLENPTYYPPAGAKDKKVIAADDPKNPLGEHWIGLEGIEGEAVGQVGYGIHGTIEPETIGKAVSLGCVRMRNQDVAMVYSMLQPGQSTVTTQR